MALEELQGGKVRSDKDLRKVSGTAMVSVTVSEGQILSRADYDAAAAVDAEVDAIVEAAEARQHRAKLAECNSRLDRLNASVKACKAEVKELEKALSGMPDEPEPDAPTPADVVTAPEVEDEVVTAPADPEEVVTPEDPKP